MSKHPIILAINPGSTSTKLAVFSGETLLFAETIRHNDADLQPFDSIADQYEFRVEAIFDALKKQNFPMDSLSAVVGRGGFLEPISSGTYLINDAMIQDLRSAKYGEHASNLGAMIASAIATNQGIPSYIVDPIVVDEFIDEARYSGIPDISRKSHLHALNVKAVVRKISTQIGKSYEDSNFVVAHLGGGISIVAHQQGKAIDVNNANDGGPFSPERAGGLPATQLVKLCFSGKYTEKELLTRLTKQGGIYAYAGTKNAEKVEEKAILGDQDSIQLLNAIVFQIAKEIGAMSTVLDGKLDGIILTGGLSHSDYIVEKLKKKIEFLSPVYLVPGEEELQSLAEGAYRVLQGKEEPKTYREELATAGETC